MSDSHDFLVKQEEWERQHVRSNSSNNYNIFNINDEASVSSSSGDGQSIHNQSGNPSTNTNKNQIQSNQSSYSTQTSQSTISNPRESLNQSINQSANNNDLLDLDDLDAPRDDDQAINQFIKKTYDMVNDQTTSDIVAWDETGDSFIVKKEFEFSSVVLPRYFRHRNFSSFVRQLNFYSFHKRSHAGKYTKFQHPYFRRNQSNLLHLIKRKSTEATSNFKDNIANLSAVVTDLKRQYDEIFTIQQHILCIFERYMKAYPLPLKDLQSINHTINKSAFPIPLVKDLVLFGSGNVSGLSPPLDERSAKRQRIVEDLTGSNISPPIHHTTLSSNDIFQPMSQPNNQSLMCDVSYPLNHFASVTPATLPTFSSSIIPSTLPPLPPVIDPSLYPSIDPATISALNASLAQAASQQQLVSQTIAPLITQSILPPVNPLINHPPINNALNPSLASLAASIYSLIDQQQPNNQSIAQTNNQTFPPLSSVGQPTQSQLSAATLDFLSRSINQSMNQTNQQLSSPELIRLLTHAAPSNQSNRLDAIHAENIGDVDEELFECEGTSSSPLHHNNRIIQSTQDRRDGYLPSNQSVIETDGFYGGSYERSMNQPIHHPLDKPTHQQQRFSSMRTKTQSVDPFYNHPSARPLNHLPNHTVNPIHVHNTCAPSTSMAASTSSFDQSINQSMRPSIHQPVTQSIHPSLQAALDQYQAMNKFDPPVPHHPVSVMNQSIGSLLPYKHLPNHSNSQSLSRLVNQTHGQDATAQAIDLASRLQIIVNVTRQLQSLQSNGQTTTQLGNQPASASMNSVQPPIGSLAPLLNQSLAYSQPLGLSHQSVHSLSRDPSPNINVSSAHSLSSLMYDDSSVNQSINQSILHSMGAPRDYLNHSQSLLLDHSSNQSLFSPQMGSMYPDLSSNMLSKRR